MFDAPPETHESNFSGKLRKQIEFPCYPQMKKNMFLIRSFQRVTLMNKKPRRRYNSLTIHVKNTQHTIRQQRKRRYPGELIVSKHFLSGSSRERRFYGQTDNWAKGNARRPMGPTPLNEYRKASAAIANRFGLTLTQH